MQFETELIPGKILNRYKRFFADVRLSTGEIVTAHTPNTGSMHTCWAPEWDVLLTPNNDPKRKLKYTLELIHNGQTWIGVHTGRTNKIVYNLLLTKQIKELSHYDKISSEIKVGKSRLDFLLENEHERCYLEVKNVTLLGDHQTALFPDSKTKRGLKHIQELLEIKKQDRGKTCLLFLVQREDVNQFAPASHIDPEYAEALFQAHEQGILILAYQCKLGPNEIVMKKKLPLHLI